MEPLLIIMLIAGAIALLLGGLSPRSAPPAPTVIFVPVDTEMQERGIGCLPVILLVLLIFVLLSQM